MKKTFIRPLLATLGILVIPLILQLTIGTGVDGQGWNWTVSDFVIIGFFLYVTGLLIELALKKAGKHRAIAVAVIILLFLWWYAEMAVGVFTNLGS